MEKKSADQAPQNEGDYLEAAAELQASFDECRRDFEHQLRQCHNVIADLVHAAGQQEMMLEAYAHTLFLLHKADHIRRLSLDGVNHIRRSILAEIKEERWGQDNYIGSIVDVGQWAGSKAIQYWRQHHKADFSQDALKLFEHQPLQDGKLWRPAHHRDNDAPDPIAHYRSIDVDRGFHTATED